MTDVIFSHSKDAAHGILRDRIGEFAYAKFSSRSRNKLRLKEVEMIFDTHAHYDDQAFVADLEDVLEKCKEAGVGRMVDVASTIESLEKCQELAGSYPQIYCALGIHPEECGEMSEETIDRIREGMKDPKALAIGEIGLDYHWETVDRETQKRWLIRQLQLAQELDKPVIIHSREAAEDTLSILQNYGPKRGGKTPGVIHCFSYSKEMAAAFLKLGFYLGVGGVLTYKNARKLREVVEMAPIDRLVLETDCPYLPPVPHRGERNSSAYLPLVAAQIGEVRDMDVQEVIAVTERNAEKLYGLAE